MEIFFTISGMKLSQNENFIPLIGFCKTNFLANFTAENSPLLEMENCCIDFDICYQTCGKSYQECLSVLKLCTEVRCDNGILKKVNADFCNLRTLKRRMQKLLKFEMCDYYSDAQKSACICVDRILSET